MGGEDIVIKTAVSRNKILSNFIQILKEKWPDAVFQDAEDENITPISDLIKYLPSEVFGYRNKYSFDLWDKEGATSNTKNTMIHLIHEENHSVTLVVDDSEENETKTIIKSFLDLFSN